MKSSILFLYMEEENVKPETKGIWNGSAIFWNVRLFMTGTQAAFREEIIIVKPIQTPHLCI